MSTRKVILTVVLALAALTLNAQFAGANPSRELTTSFGHLEEPTGIAVDLETGNVYVTEPRTDTVDIFNAAGGPPAGGVPAQIMGQTTGLHLERFIDGVAVDNSCYEHEPRLTGQACEEYDPSYGDVYVVDDNGGETPNRGVKVFKLNTGVYEQVGEITTRSLEGQTLAGRGVTVDPRGDVYMVGFPASTLVFEQRVSGGELVEILQNAYVSSGFGVVNELGNVAVDGEGDVYTSTVVESTARHVKGVIRLKVGAAGEVLSEEVFAAPLSKATTRPLAVDQATGNVYVGDGGFIAEYNSADELLREFGSSEPVGGSLVGEEAVGGIAVNSVTGQVYVVNRSGGDVDVFGAVLTAPAVAEVQPAASDLTRTSALLAGTADPEGAGGSYYFQYVSAGEYQPGSAEPYAAGVRTATETLAAGHVDENIERVVLTGLKPGTTYHYRLVVSNASGTSFGPDETFGTAPPTPPAASTGAAVEVGATGATLTGVLAPRGLPTSYRFEVGTDTSYGGAKLFGNAGEGTGEDQVSAALRFLVAGTTYHYRLVATSFDGTTYGQDQTFTTPGVASPVIQPAATPLLASATVVFPSIVGAITGPARVTKPRKASGAQRLAAALRVCRRERPGKRRAGCEARARKKHSRGAKSNDLKKG